MRTASAIALLVLVAFVGSCFSFCTRSETELALTNVDACKADCNAPTCHFAVCKSLMNTCKDGFDGLATITYEDAQANVCTFESASCTGIKENAKRDIQGSTSFFGSTFHFGSSHHGSSNHGSSGSKNNNNNASASVVVNFGLFVVLALLLALFF